VTALPLVRFEYEDPFVPEMVAVPGTTAPPKENTGVSVVDAPWWIRFEPAIRLVAVAAGTTLTVTFAVAAGPADGVTVNVYVSAPLMVPVTVTLPPLEMVVDPSVPLQEGEHDSAAVALPLAPLPAKDAKRVVVPPLWLCPSTPPRWRRR